MAEGFADRGYTPRARWCRATAPVRSCTTPAIVAERAARMAAEGVVVAVDGSAVAVEVDSVCVHGDTPGAVELARSVRTALEAAGLTVGTFAR